MKANYVALALAALVQVASAQYKGSSPKASFNNQSEDTGLWDTGSMVGAILGFAVFGIAYMYTIVYIFYDMNDRKKMYEDMV